MRKTNYSKRGKKWLRKMEKEMERIKGRKVERHKRKESGKAYKEGKWKGI